MKKIITLLVAVLMVFCIVMPVSAEEIEVNSVKEFIDAVNDKSINTIVLGSDIDFSNDCVGDLSCVFNIENKVVDLNGKSITSYHFTVIFDGNNFVLKNGYINSTNNSDYPLFIGDESGAHNAIVENVVVDGGINIYNSTNVKLLNCKGHAQSYYALWADEGAAATIEGGSYGVSEVYNSTAVIGMSNVDTALDINGGDFKSDGKPLVLKGNNYNTPVINGGTFDTEEVYEYVLGDDTAVANITTDTSKYVVGENRIEEAAKALTDGSSVIITQGSIDLTNVPDGIEVSNTGSGEVTVNGQEVTDEPVVTHTHEWVLDSTVFADDHSKADFLFVCSKDETHNQTLTDNELDVTRVEATTEEDGKVEYKASVVFEGKTYDATDTVTIAKLPAITSKDDQSFTLGSKGTLTFTSDADYDNFLKVLVDNKELAKENYTVKEGSTVVTLSNEYLNTLSAGTHELSIVSNNGTATTTFEIVKGADPEIVIPGTGINDTVMPVAIGSIILAFGAISLVVLKKRYSK